MNLRFHTIAKRSINHLVLLNSIFSLESGTHNLRFKVVAVA